MTSQEALAVAQLTRIARAEAKRQLAAGRASLAEVIDTGCCDSMPLGALLDVLPWWGPARAKRVLRPLGLDPDALVGALTPAQRELAVNAYRREMAHMSRGRRTRRPT